MNKVAAQISNRCLSNSSLTPSGDPDSARESTLAIAVIRDLCFAPPEVGQDGKHKGSFESRRRADAGLRSIASTGFRETSPQSV
ncbi:MAG: hypothetical protein E6575_12580, partial [Bradyrhizobium sp.]|nr:hypothetical protein [Bradyrhizobium sp.]